MIRSLRVLILVLMLICHSKSCSNKHNDIHILLTNIQDAGALMEFKLRSQFNLFIGERIKSIGNLLGILKTLQNDLPTDLCKYQSIDLGLNIIHALNNFINIVRKNVLYAVSSALDDAKNDQSHILYDFVMYFYDFINELRKKSKHLFNDGKGCVMNMEKEIKIFLDQSSNKFMECLKNVSISNPVQAPEFKNYEKNFTLSFRTIGLKLREPFYYIWMYSTRKQNDTAAEKFNLVSMLSLERCIKI